MPLSAACARRRTHQPLAALYANDGDHGILASIHDPVGRELVANVDLARLTEARKVDVRNQLPPHRIVYRREDAMVTVVRVQRSERLMSPTTCADG